MKTDQTTQPFVFPEILMNVHKDLAARMHKIQEKGPEVSTETRTIFQLHPKVQTADDLFS